MSAQSKGPSPLSFADFFEINAGSLRSDEQEGLALAEKMWQAAGQPRESGTLMRLLEKILHSCVRQRLRYPRILLLRKKQLDRGDWWPGEDEAERRKPREKSAPSYTESYTPKHTAIRGFRRRHSSELEAAFSQRAPAQAASLYPFIGKRVATPAGRGVLVAVFSEFVQVALDGDKEKCRSFPPEEVAGLQAE